MLKKASYAQAISRKYPEPIAWANFECKVVGKLRTGDGVAYHTIAAEPPPKAVPPAVAANPPAPAPNEPDQPKVVAPEAAAKKLVAERARERR